MRRFFAAGIILLLSFGVVLFGVDNPTASSNLYDRMGIITERGLHGAVPEENIDLFSGSLVLKNLDITLPGPNGFDLNIWRVYNSKVNTERTNTTISYPQQETSSWVGYGWTMHMGRILDPDSSNPVIEFPDGRRESTYPWTHDAGILITRNFLQLKKYNAAYGGQHTVHFQDGTVWIYGAAAIIRLIGTDVPVALVTRIVNSYGHEINIEYYSATAKLQQITDALGRVVTFDLDGSGNLDSITAPHEDGTVNYDYTVAAQAWNDSAFTRLDAMKPPVLNTVFYGYSDATTKELVQVTTSYGGTITYTFAEQSFRYFDDTMYTRSLISKTLQFAGGETATWNYTYGDYSGTDLHIDITLEDGTTKSLNGGYTVVQGPVSMERVWFFGPQPESDYGWLAGLLAIKDIYAIDDTDFSNSFSNIQYIKDSEPISTEIIWVRGQSWGAAAAALESGEYQARIGTASHYTLTQFDNATLRQYGLPSGIQVAAPYSDPNGQASSLKTSGSRSVKLRQLIGLKGSAAAAKASAQTSSVQFYTRYRKSFDYAFLTNADFAARNMRSLVSREVCYDQEDNRYKDTQWDYFPNGAIQKIRRWKSGEEWLEWLHTYNETSGPSEITITIDPPGTAGIETNIYRNGTLARAAKPGYVEYDRTIYADGLIHTESNQHGGTMTFTYDGIGRITNIAMPLGFNPITATWSQNSVAIARGGNTLTKHWDGMGRNLGFEEAGAGVTLYSRRTLDGEGRVTAESKGAVNSNHKTVFELNENGQPLQVTDPTGKWTKFAYADNTCTITDMKNNQKVLTYVHLPGLVTKISQENTHTHYYYQGENRLYYVDSSAQDLVTRRQEYSQNGLDQLVQEYHPETGVIGYQYNAEGNLASKTWSDTTMNYTYNASNQLLSETDGTEAIEFVYDGHGRVQEANSSMGSWRRYDIFYNELGALTSEKQTINGLSGYKIVEYAYDGNGLLDEITYPDGRKAAYANNALLLPQSLAFNSEANRVSAVTYGVNKQPLGYNLANGAAFSAAYDTAGRILTSGLQKSGTTLLAATYGYDNVGNIESLTNTTPSADASFQYDAFNRLTKATYPEKVYDYTYDPFGNMLTAQENSLTVFSKTYSWANRIEGFGYDGRGNLTGGDGFTQVWDKRNQMTESRTATNALLGTYTYNERGLRVKAERFGQPMVQVVRPNGGESLYLGALDTISWSSMGVTGTVKLELLVNGSVAGTIVDGLPAGQTSFQWQVGKTLTGTVNPGTDCKVRVSSVAPPVETGTTYYFYDSGGKLLSEYDGTGVCVKDYLYLGGKMIGEYLPSTSSYYYYASDQINSTRLVTDASGAIVHSAQYDPYGGLYKTWIDTYHPKPGFSGKEREFGSDLDYFGARYYGNNQYRFLSVDSEITKDNNELSPQYWNLYAFCGNNPITYLDPNGRSIWDSIKNGIAWVWENKVGIIDYTLGATAQVLGGITMFTGAGSTVLSKGSLALVGTAEMAAGAYLVATGEVLKHKGINEMRGNQNRGSRRDSRKVDTPEINEDAFTKIKNSKAYSNNETGEVFEKDRLHKNHWEVYKNRKDWEKGIRSRSVWENGKLKEKF